MEYPAHLGIGIIISVIAWTLLHFVQPGTFPLAMSITTYMICLIVVMIYSILPDIDHPISKITWFFIGAGIVGLLLGYFYVSLAILIAVFVATQFCHHRGIIHSWLIGALFCLPLYFQFGAPIAILGFTAYFSHLLADGIPFKIV